jgi:hypothetical protein
VVPVRARPRTRVPCGKLAPLPIAATVAVETSGPTPGICRNRRQASSSVRSTDGSTCPSSGHLIVRKHLVGPAIGGGFHSLSGAASRLLGLNGRSPGRGRPRSLALETAAKAALSLSSLRTERDQGSQPTMPTAFESQIRRLGLNEQTCVASKELREWCERNKDLCYIPEWLLNANVRGCEL